MGSHILANQFMDATKRGTKTLYLEFLGLLIYYSIIEYFVSLIIYPIRQSRLNIYCFLMIYIHMNLFNLLVI